MSESGLKTRGPREIEHEAAAQALAASNTLREDATIWNETRRDPDIVADIALIDSFAANLRTAGAYSDSPQQACDQGWYPDDDPYPYDDDDYEDDHSMPFACSSNGGTPGTTLVMLLMVGALVARRRRYQR